MCGGALVLLRVSWCVGTSRGVCPLVGDAAAEIQDQVNRLGALLDASEAYLMRPTLPALLKSLSEVLATTDVS